MGLLGTIGNLLQGNFSEVLKNGAELVDEYFETDQEKTQAKLMLKRIEQKGKEKENQCKIQLQELVLDRERIQADLHKAALDTTKSVITAELQQGDNFTKRARPTVIYFGLFVIFLEMFGLRLICLNYFGVDTDSIATSSSIVKSFIYTWGGYGSIYGASRGFEKIKEQKKSKLKLESESESMFYDKSAKG